MQKQRPHLLLPEIKEKKESLVTLSWPDDGQTYGSYHPADLDLRAQIRSCWRWKLSLCITAQHVFVKSVYSRTKLLHYEGKVNHDEELRRYFGS